LHLVDRRGGETKTDKNELKKKMLLKTTRYAPTGKQQKFALPFPLCTGCECA